MRRQENHLHPNITPKSALGSTVSSQQPGGPVGHPTLARMGDLATHHLRPRATWGSEPRGCWVLCASRRRGCCQKGKEGSSRRAPAGGRAPLSLLLYTVPEARGCPLLPRLSQPSQVASRDPPCPLLCNQPCSFPQAGLPLPCFRGPDHKPTPMQIVPKHLRPDGTPSFPRAPDAPQVASQSCARGAGGGPRYPWGTHSSGGLPRAPPWCPRRNEWWNEAWRFILGWLVGLPRSSRPGKDRISLPDPR